MSEAAGEAIADIIYGIVNPSGKLAETYPIKLEDYIGSKYYVGAPKTSEHREGMFVGYRYYDSAKKQVAFPFGHGLSYTTFEYSDLKLSSDKISDNDKLTITFNIKNTGKYDGFEVAQVYVKDIESTIFRPEKELKGFDKVFIKAGESATVSIELDKRSFAYYNVDVKDWVVESGEFEILVGASSRDIRLSSVVSVKGNDNITHPDYKESAPVYYNMVDAEEIPVEQFEAIYGDKMPPNMPAKRGEFDKNTTIGEMKCCIIGKLFCKFAPAVIKSQVPVCSSLIFLRSRVTFVSLEIFLIFLIDKNKPLSIFPKPLSLCLLPQRIIPSVTMLSSKPDVTPDKPRIGISSIPCCNISIVVISASGTWLLITAGANLQKRLHQSIGI